MLRAPGEGAGHRYQRWPDEDLAMAFRAGDMDAGEVLVRRYERFVYAVAVRLGSDATAVEDAYTDIWLKLQAQVANYRPGTGFRGFLGAVVRSVLIDQARRHTRQAVASLDKTDDDAPAPLDSLPGGDNIEAAILATEQQHLVQRAIGQLPERFRAPLLLYYLEGLSHNDIAARLGVPRNTVSTRIHRAREQVRQMVLAWQAE